MLFNVCKRVLKTVTLTDLEEVRGWPLNISFWAKQARVPDWEGVMSVRTRSREVVDTPSSEVKVFAWDSARTVPVLRCCHSRVAGGFDLAKQVALKVSPSFSFTLFVVMFIMGLTETILGFGENSENLLNSVQDSLKSKEFLSRVQSWTIFEIHAKSLCVEHSRFLEIFKTSSEESDLEDINTGKYWQYTWVFGQLLNQLSQFFDILIPFSTVLRVPATIFS